MSERLTMTAQSESSKHLESAIVSESTREPIWLLVFNLDGTLIDSSEDFCTSVNAALAHVGRVPLPTEAITRFIGDGAAALMRRALNASEPAQMTAMDEELRFERAFSFFLEFYREHKLDTTRLYPGVVESLASLRAAHPQLLMAVLTNKPVNPSREICDALGIAPFFFANYGGNSFLTKKPEPEGLTAILSEAQMIRQARQPAMESAPLCGVVMIGDSSADVLVARACGARALGCLYGLAPEALRAASPDVTVSSAYEWAEAMGL